MKYIFHFIIIFFSPISFAETDKEIKPITLDEATKKITENTENKVLSAETKTIAGKKVHIIKILTKKGLIQNIKINSETVKKSNESNENKKKDE